MFPDIKGIGNFFLRSSLSDEIKGLISRNVVRGEGGGHLWTYLMKAGGMSRFISWSSVV